MNGTSRPSREGALTPTTPRVPERTAGRRERLASWAGLRVDRIVRRALRGLFVRRGVPFVTAAELDHSLGLLRCYNAPDVVANPDRLLAPPAVLPEVTTEWERRTGPGVHAHLEFPTPYRPVHPSYAAEYRRYDNLDRAHLFAWRHRERAPASIVVTHGWGLGVKSVHELEFGIRWLFRTLGLDVYYYVAPYHWIRKPSRARFSGELHPSPNLMRTNEAFVQTAIELRTAFGIIGEYNPAPIGMMGSSLGGYTTALLASIDDRLAFAVPIMPPSSLAELLWEHGEHDPVRARAVEVGMTREKFRDAWALHSPMSHKPKVPWAGRLIVSAVGDGLVGEHHVDPLWEHWDRPHRVRFAGGHILQVYRREYHREIGRMLGRLGLIDANAKRKLG